MNKKEFLGKHGEDEVCNWLTERGHTVIERNWRSGHLEIDIITLSSDGIHFVEVKSRVTPVQGEPQDAVNGLKQRNIANAAKNYMARRPKLFGPDVEVWFDVAAVTYDGNRIDIQYFPAAYVPTYFGT